jgi:threonine dehydrogenase-like Zn-dependent dehydrogenase
MLRAVRALIVNDTGPIAIEDVPIPERRGECLIRVRMAGICGTDL